MMKTEKSSDLISRQDAVNEIHKYFVEEINKTPYTKDEDGDEVYTDMHTVNSLLFCNKELAKRIKALPSAEAVQGWIPCSERLPEVHPYKDVTGMTWDESDDVLICMNYGNMHVATYEVDSEARRYWVDKDGLEYTGVIAWMPLPKPYEGSESDETD